MKKQAGKKLTFSTETLRALTSPGELEQVAGGQTTAITCGCSLGCTTAINCGQTVRCTTAIICG
jgi:hypothetical protein